MTHRIFRAKSRLLAGVGLATLLLFSPVIEGSIAPAAAQSRVTVSVEFREALEPYGKFVDHPRFGEVWQPGVSRDWKPYRDGRWAYTNDYGYYWVSGESEEDWAWVVYHYGRWVLANDLGWVWVAGDRWAPAWVQWRRSRDSRGVEVVGWAPLPPDELIVDVVEEPDYWCFVPAARIFEPRISVAILPFRPVYFQQTVIVNRTVFVRNDRYRFAVNPGIEPGYFAARIGRPLRAYDIRPRVFARFGEFRGAELVRPGQKVRERLQLRETRDVIRPSRVGTAQALRPNDEGRLGERPPRAARQDQRDEKRDQARERDGQKPDQAKDGDRRDQAKERDGEKRDQAREQDKRQQAKDGDKRDQAKERAGQKQDQAREPAEQKRQQAQEQRQKATESAKQKRQQAQEQREKQRQGARERREQQQEQRGQRQQQPEERARERQGADRQPGTTGAEQRQQRQDGRGERREPRQQLNQGRAPERAARPERPQAAPPQAARPDRGPPQQAAQPSRGPAPQAVRPPRGETTGAGPSAPPQARQAPQAAPQAAPAARGGPGQRGGDRPKGGEGGQREGR